MTEIWRTTLIRFCGCTNELFGEKIARTMHIARKMKTIRYFRTKAMSVARVTFPRAVGAAAVIVLSCLRLPARRASRLRGPSPA